MLAWMQLRNASLSASREFSAQNNAWLTENSCEQICQPLPRYVAERHAMFGSGAAGTEEGQVLGNAEEHPRISRPRCLECQRQHGRDSWDTNLMEILLEEEMGGQIQEIQVGNQGQMGRKRSAAERSMSTGQHLLLRIVKKSMQ